MGSRFNNLTANSLNSQRKGKSYRLAEIIKEQKAAYKVHIILRKFVSTRNRNIPAFEIMGYTHKIDVDAGEEIMVIYKYRCRCNALIENRRSQSVCCKEIMHMLLKAIENTFEKGEMYNEGPSIFE